MLLDSASWLHAGMLLDFLGPWQQLKISSNTLHFYNPGLFHGTIVFFETYFSVKPAAINPGTLRKNNRKIIELIMQWNKMIYNIITELSCCYPTINCTLQQLEHNYNCRAESLWIIIKMGSSSITLLKSSLKICDCMLIRFINVILLPSYYVKANSLTGPLWTDERVSKHI